MKIRQLSIFLENKVGRMAGVAKILGDAGINIRGLSVADTNDFGILRLIVDDVEFAEKKLREKDVVCRLNMVTVVSLDNRPGGLAKVLNVLNAAAINIEYMYAIAEPRSEKPMIVFRFSESERAIATLENAGIEILSEAIFCQN